MTLALFPLCGGAVQQWFWPVLEENPFTEVKLYCTFYNNLWLSALAASSFLPHSAATLKVLHKVWDFCCQVCLKSTQCEYRIADHPCSRSPQLILGRFSPAASFLLLWKLLVLARGRYSMKNVEGGNKVIISQCIRLDTFKIMHHILFCLSIWKVNAS